MPKGLAAKVTKKVSLYVKIRGWANKDEELKPIIIGLFGEHVPKTVANFAKLCTGEAGTGSKWLPLHYKGSHFHKIVANKYIEGGDFILHTGQSGDSIYGASFDDENLELPFDRPFLVAMANRGQPNSNDSRFMITVGVLPEFTGTHVVFGQVISGFETVMALNRQGTQNGRPDNVVEFVDATILD